MTIDNELGGFGVTVDFDGERAVLGVRGEMDLATAPTLAAFLDAVIASGYLEVVVDLKELAFTDQSGLRVLTYAAGRLVGSGGRLTIRSPSPMVVRTLEISGMASALDVEFAQPAHRHLGPEQSRLVAEPPASESRLLIRHPRNIAAAAANDDVVDGALRLVVALARVTVGGADGVSVSLRRNGRLVTVAASDQTISDMDASQYATGEGPCVDASVEGRWFHVESLDSETRWPAFTPKALALGINAILSSPLLTEERPVGALNIYSRTATAFAPNDQRLASVFAAEASLILTDAGVDVTDVQRSTRLGEAQRVRRSIAQAEGIIMERERISADAAYTVLRTFSQRTSQPLRDRAEEVVASTTRFRSDPPPGSHDD